MIKESQNEIDKLPDFATAKPEDIQRHVKRSIPMLLKKYEDIKSLDKIMSAQSNVNIIQDTMQENLNKVIKNTQNLDVIFIMIFLLNFLFPALRRKK